MSIRVGVNGFGRIGRVFFRTALESKDIEVVGVNDLADAKTLAHLLKHDSVHGALAADVQAKGEAIFVNGREVRVCARRTRPRSRGRSSGSASSSSRPASSVTRRPRPSISRPAPRR